jgi:predicted amidohydrolase
MKHELVIRMVQAPLIWEQPEANRRNFSDILAEHAPGSDLVILPEMFTTGFTMNPERLGELEAGPTLGWMRQEAARHHVCLVGSFIFLDRGGYYNRLFWVFPDGRYQHYDKRHLFSMAGENRHYLAGQSPLLIEWEGWRIMPLICYDLRFPVWSRYRSHSPFDLLIYTANWPVSRSHHWKSLLVARAIENQAYVCGVNRVGRDGNGLEYGGDSAALDFAGNIVCALSDEAGVGELRADHEALGHYRRQFPFLHDADDFKFL